MVMMTMTKTTMDDDDDGDDGDRDRDHDYNHDRGHDYCWAILQNYLLIPQNSKSVRGKICWIDICTKYQN